MIISALILPYRPKEWGHQVVIQGSSLTDMQLVGYTRWTHESVFKDEEAIVPLFNRYRPHAVIIEKNSVNSYWFNRFGSPINLHFREDMLLQSDDAWVVPVRDVVFTRTVKEMMIGSFYYAVDKHHLTLHPEIEDVNGFLKGILHQRKSFLTDTQLVIAMCIHYLGFSLRGTVIKF